jgi:hypothetical protein
MTTERSSETVTVGPDQHEDHIDVRLPLDAPLGQPAATPRQRLIVYRTRQGDETHLLAKHGRKLRCGIPSTGCQAVLATTHDPSCFWCQQ